VLVMSGVAVARMEGPGWNRLSIAFCSKDLSIEVIDHRVSSPLWYRCVDLGSNIDRSE
jgi:hypothetical protein